MLSCGESQTWLFLLQGLGWKLDIGGDTPSVRLKVCLHFNECCICFLSCAARGGGGLRGVTAVDKSCTGKVIYLKCTMKHHCMKTRGGKWRQSSTQLDSKWRRILSLILRRISCLKKAPYIPLKGMSAVWTAVIQPVDSPLMAEYSRPVLS